MTRESDKLQRVETAVVDGRRADRNGSLMATVRQHSQPRPDGASGSSIMGTRWWVMKSFLRG